MTTDPDGWRPISLLSMVSKGLGRLLARRMAKAAVEDRLLEPEQAGGVPGVSATDILVLVVVLGKG